VFVVCMGKQTDSVFGHCDLAPPRSLLTRGSGHVLRTSKGAGWEAFILPLCRRAAMARSPMLLAIGILVLFAAQEVAAQAQYMR